jgi:hypothetical protein
VDKYISKKDSAAYAYANPWNESNLVGFWLCKKERHSS